MMKKFLSYLSKTIIFALIVATFMAALLFVLSFMKGLLLGSIESWIPFLDRFPKLVTVVSWIVMVVATMLIIMAIKFPFKKSTYINAITFTKKLWLSIPPR